MSHDMLRPALEKLLALSPDKAHLAYDFLRKINNPDFAQDAKRFLRGEAGIGGVFQQPLVRSCESKDAYLKALAEARVHMNTTARVMLGQEGFLDGFERNRVYLALGTTYELTGQQRPETRQIFAAINERRGALCPPWVAIELALYSPLPGEVLTIAMNPLKDYGREHSIFELEQGSIYTKEAAPGYQWWGGTTWVYAVAG